MPAIKTKSTAKKGGKAAKAHDPGKTDRARKAAIKEIDQRLTKIDEGPLHEGNITCGDGKVVRVTVPRDQPEEPAADTQLVAHSEQGAPTEAAPAPAKPDKPKGAKKPKTEKAPKPPKPAKEPKPKKVSALDAAAQILRDSGKAMRPVEIIAEMATRGTWTSPAGKTPEATLAAALGRDVAAKRERSRFKKADRGLFAANLTAKE